MRDLTFICAFIIKFILPIYLSSCNYDTLHGLIVISLFCFYTLSELYTALADFPFIHEDARKLLLTVVYLGHICFYLQFIEILYGILFCLGILIMYYHIQDMGLGKYLFFVSLFTALIAPDFGNFSSFSMQSAFTMQSVFKYINYFIIVFPIVFNLQFITEFLMFARIIGFMLYWDWSSAALIDGEMIAGVISGLTWLYITYIH